MTITGKVNLVLLLTKSINVPLQLFHHIYGTMMVFVGWLGSLLMWNINIMIKDDISIYYRLLPLTRDVSQRCLEFKATRYKAPGQKHSPDNSEVNCPNYTLFSFCGFTGHLEFCLTDFTNYYVNYFYPVLHAFLSGDQSYCQ